MLQEPDQEMMSPLELTWLLRVVAHYGPWVLHVTMHGVRAFFN
jgi:hypothetical protein